MYSLIKALLRYLFVRPSQGFSDTVRTRLIVWPWHLDYNMHVNNAVYLKYFEDARWDHALQTGLMKKYIDNRYGFIVASIEIGYYKEIGLFSKVFIETVLVGTDEKYIYCTQNVVDKNGKIYTSALFKAVVVKKGKTVLASEAFGVMGIENQQPLPEHFQTWKKLFEQKRDFNT